MSNKNTFMSRAQLFFYAGVLVFAVGLFTMESILTLAWLLFVATGYFYGQAKGYSSLTGGALGFFGMLGLGILLFMPDKSSTAGSSE